MLVTLPFLRDVTAAAAVLLLLAADSCAARGEAPSPAPAADFAADGGSYGDYAVDELPAPEAVGPGVVPDPDDGAPEPGAPDLGPLEAIEPEDPYDMVPEPGPYDETAEEGDLRLVRRTELDNGFVGGALQAFVGGAFGAVCSNQFTPADADVACRQLGFVGGTSASGFLPIDLEEDADILAPFVVENLNCTGAEERLLDCPAITEGPYSDYVYLYQFTGGGGEGTCDHLAGTIAGVACGTLTGPDDGDIRLAPAEDAVSEDGNVQYGRLEIFSGGGWVAVCDSTVGDNDVTDVELLPDAVADVACRQLGFTGGEKAIAGKIADVPPQDRVPGVRSVPLLRQGAVCTGSEASLAECPGGVPGTDPECGLFLPETLSLVCFSDADQVPGEDGALRLQGGQAGPGYEYGRLEIFLRGLWRTVCDGDGFTAASAALACAALGFGGGARLAFRQAPSEVLATTLPVGVADVTCAGNETSLLECARSTYFDIVFRRNPGVSSSSCAELDRFDPLVTTDSTVLACGTSTEESGSCPAPPPEQGSVRLRGGAGTPCDPLHSGIFEVFNAGEWGAICDSPFDRPQNTAAIANVVCRQLGFPYGTDVNQGLFNAEAAEPQQRFWLSQAQVRCLGPEGRLTNCDLGQGFREENSGCQEGRDPTPLTVACRSFAVPEAREADTTPGAEEGDVRLVDQTTVASWRVGRLELFSEGSWGQVCSSTAGFTGLDANVACRQLGFSGGAVAPNGPNGTFRRGRFRLNSFRPSPFEQGPRVYPEVALAGGPGCSGSEERLLDCLGGELAAAGDAGACFELERFGVGSDGLIIACASGDESGEEGALRLTDFGDGDINSGPEGGIGVLEIFHSGAWGTLCNGDPVVTLDYGDPDFDYRAPDVTLTNEAAEVACRQLGFTGGEFRGIERVPADLPPLRPSWLSDLPCSTGTESSIQDCGALAFGNTSSCGFPQRLLCDSGGTDVPLLTPRLVDGEADPGGAWAYGRLELFDGLDFVVSSDAKGSQELNRDAVQVACRTLGFAAGGQALDGQDSALPLIEGISRTGFVRRLFCTGDEGTLADCEAYDYSYNYDNYGRTVEEKAVALVCYNPSGCEANVTAPAQGDVRLVPLAGTAAPTQPCDEVHLGGVEFFNDGQWGRLCITGFRSESSWTVDATIACRQLGFPFGSLMDNDNSGGDAYDEAAPPTWASFVFCTGFEERLEDCEFPEEFGAAGSEIGGRPDLSRPCRDEEMFSVICRRFPMEESLLIRR